MSVLLLVLESMKNESFNRSSSVSFTGSYMSSVISSPSLRTSSIEGSKAASLSSPPSSAPASSLSGWPSSALPPPASSLSGWPSSALPPPTSSLSGRPSSALPPPTSSLSGRPSSALPLPALSLSGRPSSCSCSPGAGISGAADFRVQCSWSVREKFFFDANRITGRCGAGLVCPGLGPSGKESFRGPGSFPKAILKEGRNDFTEVRSKLCAGIVDRPLDGVFLRGVACALAVAELELSVMSLLGVCSLSMLSIVVFIVSIYSLVGARCPAYDREQMHADRQSRKVLETFSSHQITRRSVPWGCAQGCMAMHAFKLQCLCRKGAGHCPNTSPDQHRLSASYRCSLESQRD